MKNKYLHQKHCSPPKLSTSSGDRKFEYVFGGGLPLRQAGKYSAQLITGNPAIDEMRHYLGGMEFKNGVLEAYNFGDGRVVWENSVPKFQYRLHDHLGNTVVFFEDKNNNGCITTEEEATGPADLEIVQRLLYYPFGMALEGLGAWNAQPWQQYRYNGKERDTLTGWYDYGARWGLLDIGRWNAVDPLADQYVKFTPYGYVANNPIRLIDPDGMRIEYADMSKQERKALKQHIRKLYRGSETFNQIWKDLKKSDHTHTIHSTSPSDMHVDAKGGDYLAGGNSSDIFLNPSSNSVGMPQEIAIAHEVGHAWRIDQGLEPEYYGLKAGEKATLESLVYAYKHKQYREFEATHIENVVRSEMGYSLREVYGDLSDNHTGNTTTIFGKEFLDTSKNRNITVGRDRGYDYSGGIIIKT